MSHPSSWSPAEAYLQDWHVRHPAAGRVFESARDPDGRSSCQRLGLLATRDKTVLDLACGSGSLLALLAATEGHAQHVGIDMTRPELALARTRIPTADVCCARAQTLPLASASVDVVLCHMAFMLLDDPDLVLSEARRVLRTGGVFGAVTNRRAAPGPIAKRIIAAIKPLMEGGDERLRAPKMGDPLTLESDGLSSLVSSQFENVSAESFDVTQLVPRDHLWPFLVESIYGFDAMSADEAVRALDELELPDPVPWTIPMLEVRGWV